VDDGWLNLSLVKTLNALEVLALVPRLLRNGSLPACYLNQTKARKVVLRTDRACFFHGDGEILGPAPAVEDDAEKIGVKLFHDVVAVSYTHLDVYKRQDGG